MYLCALHESRLIVNLPPTQKDVLFDIFLGFFLTSSYLIFLLIFCTALYFIFS